MLRRNHLVGLCLLITCVAWVDAKGAGESPRLADEVVGPWQLFVDDYLIAGKTNVLRRYHPFKKVGDKPLIVVDKPWEQDVVAACSVLPTEDGSGYRMYYYCWTKKEDKRGSFMCYATSKDGITWEKPNLGLFDYKGSKDNNIIPNGPGAVIRTPWETDPNKRYQGVGGQYHACTSPDGLNWKRVSENDIVKGGDTSHFYWDPHKKKFIALVKVNANVSGLRRRAVGYAESTDLKKFPTLRMVMAPDDLDDTWVHAGTVERTHFYACPTIPYESIYVGFMQIYRADDPEGYFHGPLWVELVTSRDGVHYNREESHPALGAQSSLQTISRPPLLDIGKYRQFDHGMLFCTSLLVVGDEIRTYYSGYDDLHDLLPYHSAISMAKMRKDGFVSLDADEATGDVLTKRIEGAGGELQVNCDPRGGSLRVEVLNADGQVVPGYAHEDCEPVKKDFVRTTVTWKNNKVLPASGPIRLRFILEHARLFSFMAGENVKIVDEPTVPLQALFTFEGDTEAWSDMLPADGLQVLRNLGTCTLDHKKPDPAFGKRSLVVGSGWRPWNRVEIGGTDNLGRQFTLAAMVKCTDNRLARLFSAYNGNFPVNTSELIFDFDPRGRAINGLRLFCKGMPVESEPVKFDDNKYHHLAVVYDDGEISFYLDGKAVGRQWMPGGEPVKLARNLLVGEDANMGSDEQLTGNVDDVLVIGRALSQQDIDTLAHKGAAVLFGEK